MKKTLLLLLTGLPLISLAQKVKVSSKSSIFLAGQIEEPRDNPYMGMLPVAIPVAGLTAVQIDSMVGRISCAETLNGADGGTCVSTESDINSLNGIAGIIHHSKTMFLVGVFINDGEFDNEAPERLDCSNFNNIAVIRPGMEQVFFIGDGRDARKNLQRIIIPKGATTLYLGIADAPAFHGDPGTYDDNDGSLGMTIMTFKD